MNELTKTPDTFSDDFAPHDFVVENELTVTITLSEYRSLISSKAASDARISSLYSENHRLQTELKELKEKWHESSPDEMANQ